MCLKSLSSLSPFRLLAVIFSHSVQALGPVSASTSPWWWWNPSWSHCSPSTPFAFTRAWLWTASSRPTTCLSSLWSIRSRTNSSAWDSYRDREVAGRWSEAQTFAFFFILFSLFVLTIYVYVNICSLLCHSSLIIIIIQTFICCIIKLWFCLKVYVNSSKYNLFCQFCTFGSLVTLVQWS